MSSATTQTGTADVEYLFPWGWGELEGIANRTDYDLTQHAEHSGVDLEYYDQQADERYRPHVIEPAAGATRTMMAFLLAAFDTEEVRGESPVPCCGSIPGWRRTRLTVLPLSKKPELQSVSEEILGLLQPRWMTDYDVTQSIGRRYRRQDEIGTPYLCDRGLRHPGRPGRHHSRPGHHGPRPGAHRQALIEHLDAKLGPVSLDHSDQTGCRCGKRRRSR